MTSTDAVHVSGVDRCGNVASILELDENLNSTYQTFEAAAQVRFSLALTSFLSKLIVNWRVCTARLQRDSSEEYKFTIFPLISLALVSSLSLSLSLYVSLSVRCQYGQLFRSDEVHEYSVLYDVFLFCQPCCNMFRLSPPFQNSMLCSPPRLYSPLLQTRFFSITGRLAYSSSSSVNSLLSFSLSFSLPSLTLLRSLSQRWFNTSRLNSMVKS